GPRLSGGLFAEILSGRLQAGRGEPLGEVRRGLRASCSEQQLLALLAGRQRPRPLAVSIGLDAQTFFERHGLLETASCLHDALLSFEVAGAPWRSRHRQLPKASYGDGEMLRLPARTAIT